MVCFPPLDGFIVAVLGACLSSELCSALDCKATGRYCLSGFSFSGIVPLGGSIFFNSGECLPSWLGCATHRKANGNRLSVLCTFAFACPFV